jgi:hypothetical protein
LKGGFDMAAEKGNKYAEKVTIEEAIKLAERAYNAVSSDCYFISSVAEECETYRDKFAYILEKFNDDEKVFRTIKRMYNKCESIVMQKTADGDITPALGIFVLKAYHGLMESSRQQIDQNVNGNLNILNLGSGTKPNEDGGS